MVPDTVPRWEAAELRVCTFAVSRDAAAARAYERQTMAAISTAKLSLAVLVLVAGCGGAAGGARPSSPEPESNGSTPAPLPDALSLESVTVIVVPASTGAAPRDLLRASALAFARYVHATRVVEVCAREEQDLARILAAIEPSVAAGSAPVHDGEQARTEQLRARASAIAAADELREATSELAALLGFARDAALPPPGDLVAEKARGARDAWTAQAAAIRAGDDPVVVRAEVDAAHQRLAVLLQAWDALHQGASSAATDPLDAPLARYAAGMVPASALFEAAAARRALDLSIAELTRRIASASADVDHAVGARIPREPLPR